MSDKLKTYEAPEIEVVKYNCEDVLSTTLDPDNYTVALSDIQ